MHIKYFSLLKFHVEQLDKPKYSAELLFHVEHYNVIHYK